MTRAAIYARYSSDQQREASIEDQVRLCEERAASRGLDRRTTLRRSRRSPAPASCARASRRCCATRMARRFDVVLTESLDRLSRDQEDIAGVYKRLRFAGVRIVTLSEGEIGELHIGFKGTMGALYLKDLADKTRRGLRGRVEAGLSGGGNSYGYDVVTKFAANGEPERGERRINADRGRRSSARSSATTPPASRRRRSPSPSTRRASPARRGKGWGQSTINGNCQRGTGILNNELYVGQLVWNRLTYIKNPETGKRVSRLNPESAWIIKDVPELRIVDQELWDRVKARQRGLHEAARVPREAAPAHAALVPADLRLLRRRLQQGLAEPLRLLDRAQQGHLRQPPDHPAGRARGPGPRRAAKPPDGPGALRRVLRGVHRQRNALRGAKNAQLAAARTELAKLAKDRDRLVQAIKDGVPGAEVKDDLARIAARREELEALLASTTGRAGPAASRHGGALPPPGRRRSPRRSTPKRTAPKPRTSCAG